MDMVAFPHAEVITRLTLSF